MTVDLRNPPSLAAALHIADQIQQGLGGRARANELRAYVKQAVTWMAAVASQEERDLDPQLLVDINRIFSALGAAGIAGVVRLRVAPPSADLPGEYSVEMDFGKLIGEAAQLANTIDMIGKAMALRPVEPPAPPEEEHWEPPIGEPDDLAHRSLY